MACKTPVITSNVSSLPEVCGDAAIYCDPYNVDSIKNALEKSLNLSKDLREKLIQNGLKRVEFFNLDDYKNRILNVYESVL
jgi:glycosyltransferase involved in cell wall biosynthesis